MLRQADTWGRVSAAQSSGGEDWDCPDWTRCEQTGCLQINSRVRWGPAAKEQGWSDGPAWQGNPT